MRVMGALRRLMMLILLLHRLGASLKLSARVCSVENVHPARNIVYRSLKGSIGDTRGADRRERRRGYRRKHAQEVRGRR